MIGKRNYRLSDVVAMVCTPCALLLYLHLALLTRPLPEQSNWREGHHSSVRDAGSQWREAGEIILTPKPKAPVPYVPPPPPELLGPPLNVTGRGDPNRLLYTPILQSGASSMKYLLGYLKRENHFKLITEPPQKTLIVHIEKDDVKARIVNKTAQLEGATALVHSFAYFDFDKYGGHQPIHISVVREPVDRAISLFYRVRAPYQVVERHTQFPELSLPKRSFLKKSIEVCLSNPSDRECRYAAGRTHFGHTVEFFCGHHPQCSKFGSEEALAMAQRNVDKSYAVVGLLEEWPMTLAVLERYVPQYFANATRKYYDKIDGVQKYVNKNFYKPEVAPWVKEQLAQNMTVEIKFYEFLKRRLKRQYEALIN